MKVNIPISSFSRKILSKDFGSMRIGMDTGEARALASGIRISQNDSRLDILTDVTEIDVSSSISNRVKRLGAGIHLHMYHLDRMMHFIYTHYLSEELAVPYVAIKKFYKIYDLEYNDYDIDAAFRRWQRFLSKKKEGKSKNLSINYICKKKHIYSIEEVESRISTLVNNRIEEFLTKKNRFKTKFLKQIRVAMYHKCGYSVYEINSILGYNTRTIRSIIRRMEGIFAIYKYDDVLKS